VPVVAAVGGEPTTWRRKRRKMERWFEVGVGVGGKIPTTNNPTIDCCTTTANSSVEK